MITRMTIQLSTVKAAKQFGEALNEALDTGEDSLVDIKDREVAVTWGDDIDPTDLLDALTEARDAMEWEF